MRNIFPHILLSLSKACFWRSALCAFFVVAGLPAVFPQTGGLGFPKKLSQYSLKHWGSQNGLVTSAINDLHQSRDGYVWLATYNGAIRFDGLDFTVFNSGNTQNIKGNSVYSIAETDKGDLWLATQDGGMIHYSSEKQFETLDSVNGFTNEVLNEVFSDSKGTLWVSPRANGFYKFENGHFTDFHKQTKVPEYQQLAVSKFYEDENGILWIATLGKGLAFFNENSFTSFGKKEGLGDDNIKSLAGNGKGGIWVGTEGAGLCFFEKGKFTKIDAVEANSINSLAFDGKQSLWAATEKGLFLFDTASGQVQKIDKSGGLPENDVDEVMLDKEGNVWVASRRGGLTLLKSTPFNNFSMIQGLANDVINSIIQTGPGSFLIGGEGGAVDRIDAGIVSPFKLKNPLPHHRIKGMLKDSGGNFWISTYNGLVKQSPDGAEKLYNTSNGLSNNTCRTVFEDSNRQIWLGTKSGLNLIGEKGITVFTKKDGLSSPYIMDLFEAANGDLFVSTGGGGINIVKKGGFSDGKLKVANVINEAGGLFTDLVFGVREYPQGVYWAMTSKGLSRFTKKQDGGYSVFNFTKNAGGFPEQPYFDMLLDRGGYAWLPGNQGLLRVAIKDLDDTALGLKKDKISYSTYTESDGLRQHEFTGASKSFIDDKGMFWFPTLGGVEAVDPVLFVDKNLPDPVLLLENVMVDTFVFHSAAIEAEQAVRLEIKLTGVYFHSPEDLMFSYKMDGFDEGWSAYSKDRRPTYTKIPPGDYVFYARTLTKDGVESPPKKLFSLKIEGLFYEKAWFKILMLFVAVGGFWLVFTLRIKYVNKIAVEKSYILEKLVSERTDEIRRQQKAMEKNQELLAKSFKEQEIQKAYTSKILDTLPEVVFVADKNGIITNANVFAYKMSGQGYSLVGQNCYNIFPVSPTEFQVIYQTTMLQPGGMQQTFSAVIGKYSKTFKLLTQAIETPYTDEKEILVVGIDVSEEKEQEEALKAAKEEAERANQAKSYFLSAMSHELRTPLNAITGMAQILSNLNADDSLKKHFAVLMEGAGNLESLIADILEFTQIESGDISFGRQVYNIEEQMRACAENAARLVGEGYKASLDFRFEAKSEHHKRVIGDAGRFRQVLSKIVHNALKFGENGAIVLSVKCIEEKNNALMFLVSVKDEGKGIPDGKAELIFEKFEQADNSFTRKHGGSGLGLSICKAIVQKQGGKIWAENHPDKGAVFYFTWFADVTYPAAGWKDQDVKVSMEDLKGKKAVVVSSGGKISEMLGFMEKWQLQTYKIDAALPAADIARAVYEAGAGLVFIDRLPEQDLALGGAEAIRRAFAKHTADTPFFIALSESDQTDAYILGGCNEHISPDIRPRDLYKLLHCYLVGNAG